MTTPPPPPEKRRRNAAATRRAILASARLAFARQGYEGAGVREIAAGAGVTAMLVNRYFGSKEGLFAEVLAESMASTSVVLPAILARPVSGERVAAALVDITAVDAVPLEGFQIMMRSASSDRAAAIAREQIERFQLGAIASLLDGAHAPQRAALVLALIAGFQMMRQMIGLSPLAEADRQALVDTLAPLFERLLA
ncbi:MULTISPECIES: TetR family transcriptional regulator [unclassified Burkholderia]|uniref:TetR/AcrR family transcriptional regulator n=1 Tax=unclassified Burkholderia TaxID=2613784 RepID=UPI0004690F30|nr:MULTISPECIES: TetR family transcriptional regulator [unclassified Burkholderia]NIE84556.1 helix-turn-helix transcriptional regulator [Burkholderia sp. Tr-860]NIF62938.1 helix-turn-helix transcriptional regulator [Burkholderia sp. Cy-647]NIF97441.1 helix-turn-helix transcriptional regulator [Burkholderia sp. Ax-1720]